MTIVEMLGQSGILTLLGMGIVFSFLVIVIISVTLVGKFIHAIGADTDGAKPAPAAVGAVGSATGPTIAAITAAVTEYRKTNG